ncbi:MAG TPA: TonB-dependent receptor [Ramlibacter sp.]|nr:TonB-dependent receptor [Ramlibacter sp.]
MKPPSPSTLRWRQAAGLALAAGLPGLALAQAPGEPTLRPVTVTVTRGVEQRAFDTPASVDVVDGATLRNGQLQVNLSESLARVPGLVAQNRQNYAQDLQISSRGFGARSTFGVRGIRLYADGIPASGPDGQGQVSHFDIASAQRIEVLRGPFSVLYGNASGGVISLFTEDGGPQAVADLSAAFGSDGIRRLGLKLGGAQGQLQYTLSASRFETDGSRGHSAAQRDSFNGKLKYSASDDTRITFVLNSVRMPDVQDPLGLTRAEFQANPRQASPAALLFDTRKSVDQLQAGAVLEQRLGGGNALQFTLYTGERGTQQFQAIPVGTQAPATHPGGVIDLERRYQGLDARWISKQRWWDNPATLTVGISADQTREDRRGTQNFVGASLGVQGALRRDEANRLRSFDQYLQAEWVLAERWSALAGLRHSQVRFESRDRYIVPGNGDDSGAVRYEATTPALGVVFHATDTLNLYAAAGRGFETPTFNELAYRPGGAAGLNFGLTEATSRQWEAGVKAELSAQWKLNAAVFQARSANEIVVLTNAGGRSIFQNAGATRRDGFEAALSGRLGEAWSTHLAATVLNARYSSGFLTCVAAPCTTPTTPIAAGNRMPGIPRLSLFGELAWKPRGSGLEAALEWRHVGRIAVDDANSDFAPAASTLALRLGLTQQIGRWTLREFARVDNLADKAYAGSVIVNEANRRFFEPAPGRSWLLGLNAAYQF